RAGKLRVLAVTSAKRLAAAPELPTAAEQGFAGMTVIRTIGLPAPHGTPAEIVERIAPATPRVTADAAFTQMPAEGGMEPMRDSNADQLRKSLAADVAFWSPIVKTLGLKLD